MISYARDICQTLDGNYRDFCSVWASRQMTLGLQVECLYDTRNVCIGLLRNRELFLIDRPLLREWDAFTRSPEWKSSRKIFLSASLGPAIV